MIPDHLIERSQLTSNGDHAWPADDLADVVAAFAREGLAVTMGDLYVVSGDGVLVHLDATEACDYKRSDASGFGWECVREPGEQWSDYLARSMKRALNQSKALIEHATSSLLHKIPVLVALRWATESLVWKFELPQWVRETERRLESGPWVAWAWGWMVQPSRDELDRYALNRAKPEPGSFFGSAASSLVLLPRDATFVHVDGRARDLDFLEEFRSLAALSVQSVDDRALATISKLGDLRYLKLVDVRGEDLTPLAELTALRHLALEGVRRVQSIEPISHLLSLRTLRLMDCRAMRDVEPIAALTKLLALGIGEAIWTRTRLPSLSPVGYLAELRQLDMGVSKIDDQSLAPVARLKQLRSLELSNTFPLDELARLVVALPETPGSWQSPWIWEPDGQGFFLCPRCKAHRRGLTAGRPQRRLCPRCDAAKVAKHLSRWQELIEDARSRDKMP